MRDGAEMTENGLVLKEEEEEDDNLGTELEQSRDTRRSVMYSELGKSLAASATAAVICFIMVQGEVHTWKVNVIPVGKYSWAFVSTLVFFASLGVIYAAVFHCRNLQQRIRCGQDEVGS